MFSDSNSIFVEPTRNEMMKNLEKELGNVLDSGNFKTDEGKEIFYFEQGIDMNGQDVNSTIFFFDLKGTMIMGTINIAQHRVSDWKDICLDMVASIEITGE